MRHRRASQRQILSHFRHPFSLLFSIVLMIFAGCGCGVVSISISTAPISTPKPSQVLAVPSAAPASYPAGWLTATSSNWCGYTFPQGNITGVRAQWTEPSVSTQISGADVVTWVGIGGRYQSYNNIIQIGTRAAVRDGRVIHDVWYETLPPSRWYSLGAISAGDSVAASVTLKPGSTRQWDLSLVDLTTHQVFQTSASFSSQRIYADYIVEDPGATSNNGPPFYSFPAFTPITISKANVRYANDWLSIAAISGVQITLKRANVTLALPGPFSNDTFTVRRILS